MMSAGYVQPRPGLTPYQPREGGPCFLSDMIIELGFADEQHVAAAVETARSSGETVGRILVREGLLSEDQLAHGLAARYGLNHIDLDEFEIDPDAANLLPPTSATRYKAVPVGFEPDGSLLVAMADPSDSLALSDIAFMTHLEVRATVAAADRIAGLAGRLPLPPNELGGSRFPVAATGTEREPVIDAAPPPPPVHVDEPTLVLEPAAPQIDDAEFERLRAELDELRRQAGEADTAVAAERDAARSELETLRAELDRTRGELEAVRAERDAEVSELERARSERDTARNERDGARAEIESVRSERDALRGERDGQREQLDSVRSELESARADLDQMKTEAEQRAEAEARAGQARTEAESRAAEADRRAAEFERRLAEAGDAEQRVAEAHSMVEKMRTEFEVERESYAATDRELRAKLASETERHEALKEAHGSLQKRVEVLRSQNAALLDAYATAKRWSEEFARGARELAATLEQPVLDDAVRAQSGQPSSSSADS